MSRTSDNRPGVLKTPSVLLGIAAAIAAIAALCLPSIASADYEQVPEHFGVSGEADQLYRSRAMAINVDGAGGVEPGSIYVVGINGRVLRFSPGKEGEAPQFREAWGWGIAKGGPFNEFVKCGPAYAAEPRPAHTFPSCEPPHGNEPGGEQVGHLNELSGVAVDQATGGVYVLNSPNSGVREHHLIEVFTATGTPIGEGFGDWGRKIPFPSESIAEGPEKLHEQSIAEEDGIAVDEAGTVYAIDRDFAEAPGTHAARVMSFEPESPGDYEHYVYAGQGKDLTINYSNSFNRIALLGPDRLVTESSQLIREYATGGGSTPLCSREVKGGEAAAMAANPLTGEVFFFVRGRKSNLRRLGPCDEASEEFEELQSPLAPTPETDPLFALALNPSLQWGPLRPAGVLYGANAQIGEAIEEKGIGDVFVPAEAQPPEVLSESVANTTSSSSTLQAQVDPHGSTTAYRFEYLSEAEYLANGESFEGPNVPRLAPASPGQLGGGAVGLAAASVAGLVPDTEYRFRATIASECLGKGQPPCEAVGPAFAFRTYPPAIPGLPDGRAYELVSPAQKQGGEVFPAEGNISSCLGECKPPGGQVFSVFPMQSTPGGNAVSYMGFPFSPEEGAAVDNSYISRRTSSGWQTTTMSPRRLEKRSSLAYDESLGQGAITTEGDVPLAENAPSGYTNLYLQDAADPAALQPLLSEALFGALEETGRPYREPGLLTLKYAGHSLDFAAQFFTANDSLTFASPYAPQPPEVNQVQFDLYESRGGQLSLVNVLPGNTEVASGASFASGSPDAHGISIDGSRVFWEAAGHLYVREDGEVTRKVPGASATAKFLTANPTGTEVLLADGRIEGLNEAGTTYEQVADLTQGKGGFSGIAGASEDLSRIYFVDTAALPGSGQNERDEEAQVGTPNLYLYDAGAGTSFVATLVSSDGTGGTEDLDDWAAKPGLRTAEASPDGRYLAFGSTAQLTGYANVGPCGKTPNHTAFVDVPCKEVFLYDSTTGKLSCPSCNPSGEAPLGNSTLRGINGADNREWLPQPRYLTNQGRLFFDSGDRLSPRDTNGRVEDVYEAEPQGVGGCERAQGCVTLITPGTGSIDSNFLAMDESGANVFFTTREPLVLKDTDELIDVYDARSGGGFPSETETTRPECQGEACQPSPNPPAEVTPASAAFKGAGNLNEGAGAARCPKGKRKARSNGKARCVTKHKKAREHKRGHKANDNRRAQR